jgi:hypothetical protein
MSVKLNIGWRLTLCVSRLLFPDVDASGLDPKRIVTVLESSKADEQVMTIAAIRSLIPF